MNELLFFVTIIINFAGIVLAYKLFQKTGLFIWIAFATIIANIEVLKSVNMFGLNVTLGNVIYGTIFLATDALNELYGKKEARKGVLVGFFSMTIFTALITLSLLFVPSSQDFANESMRTLFKFMPRILGASMTAYLVSNLLDATLYDFIRGHSKDDKFLWLRNNGSTMLSQMLDTIVFTLIAFTGVFAFRTVLEIMLFTYIIKVIVAICDTPFLYLIRKIHKPNHQDKKQASEIA